MMSEPSYRRSMNLIHEIDRQHPATGMHSRGVTALMLRMNEEGPEIAPAQTIALAGMLHDVGKLRVPHAVLDVPRPLEPSEIQLMKGHPEKGVQVLDAYKISDPTIRGM